LTTTHANDDVSKPDHNNSKIELLVDGDIIHAKPPQGIEYSPLLVTITIMKYKSNYILVLDPTAEEEACSYAQIHIAIIHSTSETTTTTTNTTTTTAKPSDIVSSSYPMVDSVLKTGYGSLPHTLMIQCIQMAIQYSVSIHQEHYKYVTLTTNTTTSNNNNNLPRLQEEFLIQ
jgi:exosome complex RNA-binding protein Rrp42 (RNase PH superfamily)